MTTTRINVHKNTTNPGEHKLFGWFNPQTAERFSESLRWDGNNNRGVISGLECGFEELYLTAGGQWVRHYDASGEFNGPNYFEFITPVEAREWLLRAEGEDDAIVRLFGPIAEEAGPVR